MKSVNYDTQMPLQAVDEAGGVRKNQELSKEKTWQIVSTLDTCKCRVLEPKSLKYKDLMISANMCIHKFSRTHRTTLQIDLWRAFASTATHVKLDQVIRNFEDLWVYGSHHALGCN